MKPLPLLLVNAALVVLGLLAYDALRDRDGAPAPTPDAWLPAGSTDAAPRLETASGFEQRLGVIESRLAALETATARLRLALPQTGTVDTSALRELLPPPDGEIDDKALEALEVHLREIDRRRRLASQVEQVNRNLDRLDLRLGDDDRQTVIRILLAYQAGLRTFWQDLADRGITDRKQQLEELSAFKTRVMKELGAVIPEQDLERATRGLIGRESMQVPPGAAGPPVPPSGGGFGR